MGDNHDSEIDIKDHSYGLSVVSLNPCGSPTLDNADNDDIYHYEARQTWLDRQTSEDSTSAEVVESIETTEMQRRLFQQKYKALKVQKEKKIVDRSLRTPGRQGDKNFQLPDDVRSALNSVCSYDSLPKPTSLPKIVSEGVLLFTPESATGKTSSRTEQGSEGRTTRREKEVRIVENRTPREGSSRSDKRPEETCEFPTTDAGKNKHSNTSNRTDNKSIKRNGSGKRTTSATKNSRANSGKSETSQTPRTCWRSHDATTPRPFSRPTSTSTTSSAGQNSKVPKRRPSHQHRRKSRVSSIASSTKGRTVDANESSDSDYFDSDSDIDHGYTPSDANYEVSLYQRACRHHHVVTSRRVEEGLKKGEVDVSFSQVTPEELKVICIAIVESANISRLDLTGNKLSEQSLSHICEVMKENKYIKNLVLSDCQADRRGVGNLVRCLQRKNTVAWLDISGTALCLEQVKLLSEYIQNSSSLQRLCLSYCEIDEAGANILAEALGSAICLTYLDLSWNQLRHKGALNFCMALKDNDTLQYLDLSWNGLGRDGCVALEVSLASNSTLRHLDISSNRIGVQGLDCLLRGLHSNTVLTSIKMGNNPLPTESGTAVIEALINSPNSALRVVDMSYIAVEDEFITKLTELRKSRVIYIYYGHVLSRKKDLNGATGRRSLASFDPVLVLFEYMKLQNMRLIDLFRSIDTNGDKVISKQELRAVFLSLNMALPTGTFDAMFKKMDRDNNNTIDMDEMKFIHRRVMRQARALKARASKSEDEFGDVMHEFQDLVRKAVATRRTQPSSRKGSAERGLHSPDPFWGSMDMTGSPRGENGLLSPTPNRRLSQRRLSPARLFVDALTSASSRANTRRSSSMLSMSSSVESLDQH